MKSKVLNFLLVLFYLCSIISFYSNRISPLSLGGLPIYFCYAVPFFLIMNVILLLRYCIKKSKRYIIISICILLFGTEHFLSTFTFHPVNHEKSALKVLSYNVRVFNTYTELRNDNYTSSSNMIQWIKECNADVICLQEFYNLDTDTLFNVTNQLFTEGYKHTFISTALTNSIGATFGLAIFSKLPLEDSGEIIYDSTSQNSVSYVDINIQNTPIRIYNAHMQSNYLSEKDGDTSGILETIKRSSMRRTKQLESLIHHIRSCSKRVVLAGDFNDLPYSYTYRQVKNILNNGFEDKGNGFGFTFNSDLFFLRIDNQFYGKGLKINNFETHRDVPYSDHFPISATYSIDNDEN